MFSDFQKAYEGKIWCLCTVTFGQKVPTLNSRLVYCSRLYGMRNLKKQVKKAFCYQKLFWPFTVRTNCSRDLKNFANFQPSASNFKRFSRSLEQFLLTVGQNNFGNKIPFLDILFFYRHCRCNKCKARKKCKTDGHVQNNDCGKYGNCVLPHIAGVPQQA